MNDFKNQPHKLIYHTNGKSLQEINGTVKVPKDGKFFRTLLAYSGPGALVAVGTWIRETGQPQSQVDKIFNIY